MYHPSRVYNESLASDATDKVSEAALTTMRDLLPMILQRQPNDKATASMCATHGIQQCQDPRNLNQSSAIS